MVEKDRSRFERRRKSVDRGSDAAVGCAVLLFAGGCLLAMALTTIALVAFGWAIFA